jgi:hypothetical protein
VGHQTVRFAFCVLAGLGILVGGGVVEPDLVLAGFNDPPPSGGPAPLIGIGLPIAGAVVATVLVAHHFRRKH